MVVTKSYRATHHILDDYRVDPCLLLYAPGNKWHYYLIAVPLCVVFELYYI